MKKMCKKISLILMTTLLMLSTVLGAVSVSANNDDITVALDGRVLEFDVPPQIINGRTMVPMRAIFEALGTTVEWDAETRSVYAIRGDQAIVMQIDSNLMVGADDNGTFVRYLDAAPVIVDGRTLIPARAVSEALQCEVGWVAETRRVNLTSGKGEKMKDVYYPKTAAMTVDVPTYDCVTGATCLDADLSEEVVLYSYTINNDLELFSYISALETVYGFTANEPESDENTISWYLTHESGASMMIVYYDDAEIAEVWVLY